MSSLLTPAKHIRFSLKLWKLVVKIANDDHQHPGTVVRTMAERYLLPHLEAEIEKRKIEKRKIRNDH